MFQLSYLTIAAVAIGVLTTLVLAAWFTPARWWRQLNARALAIVGLGTWGIASLVLWLAQAQAPAMATPLVLPDAGRQFTVHDDLNLREAKGPGSKRIAVVPAGSVVTATGARDGDWWQLSAQVGGQEVRGWSSSLWLRRPAEARPTP
jgi:hypothetical protein